MTNIHLFDLIHYIQNSWFAWQKCECMCARVKNSCLVFAVRGCDSDGGGVCVCVLWINEIREGSQNPQWHIDAHRHYNHYDSFAFILILILVFIYVYFFTYLEKKNARLQRTQKHTRYAEDFEIFNSIDKISQREWDTQSNNPFCSYTNTLHMLECACRIK